MTRGTAYAIAGNPDVIATHAGPNGAGKYCGFITRGEEQRYEPLISTGPLFDTPEAADEAMRKVIAAAMEWVKHDLDDPRNLLIDILTGKEGPAIRQVVAAAAR